VEISKKDIEAKIIAAQDAYFNDEPIIEDSEYDALVDLYEKNFGEKPNVGAAVKTNKIVLKIPMASLDKIRDSDGTMEKFFLKEYSANYIVSDKLDGGSLQFVYDDGKIISAATRGDGTIGKDVSHMIPHMNIPKTISKMGTVVVKAEGVVPHSKFKKVEHLFKNARNLANGILNKQTIHEHMDCLEVIAHGTMNSGLSPKTSLQFLESEGFKTVFWKEYGFIMKSIADFLKERQEKSDILIDGLVISADEYEESGIENPDMSVAFKGENVSAVAEIVAIKWELSKHGYWKPVAEIKPIELSGVTISNVTAYNYGFVRDNMLNTGALITIIRSGEVIPKIISIVNSAQTHSVPPGEYQLTETGVDAFTTTELDSKEVRCKFMAAFLAAIGVENIAQTTVETMFDAGFTELEYFWNKPKSWYNSVPGFVTKGEKIHDSVHAAISNVDFNAVAANSGFFGRNFGTRRIEAIASLYDFAEFRKMSPSQVYHKVIAIDGFSEITTTAFVRGFMNFMAWQDQQPFVYKKVEKIVTTGNTFANEVVAFTGVRCQESEEMIVKLGGTIASGVNKKTTILVCKDPSSKSSKMQKALDFGAKVLSLEELKAKIAG
jgi:DNA ligase (NAD+)